MYQLTFNKNVINYKGGGGGAFNMMAAFLGSVQNACHNLILNWTYLTNQLKIYHLLLSSHNMLSP